MMRWRCILSLAIVQFAGWPAMAHAGTELVSALSKAQAPRADAFGGAAAALDADASLVWINPASGRVDDQVLAFSGQRGRFRELAGQVLAAGPLLHGTGSVGVLYYDAGTAAITTSEGTILNIDVQRDLLGQMSYCRDIMPGITTGATLKGFYSSLFSMANSHAFALDAGVQVKLPQRITAGVLAQNLGTRLKYFEDSISLPAALRGGLARPWTFGRDLTASEVIVLADADYSMPRREMAWRGGAEYTWRGIASLRAGTYLSERKKTVNAGFGVKYASLRLDYSAQFGGVGDVPHNISLSYVFKEPKPAPEAPAKLSVVAPPIAGVKKTMNASMAFAPRGLDLKVPIKEWKAVVTDKYDRVVKTIVGIGTPPKELEWDGLDDRGRPVVDISSARISLNMKDVVDKPIEAKWIMPVASAEPQLRTINSPLADSEVKFGMPQHNFQCWQLQVKDGSADVASWEGAGVPAQISWSGVDAAGKPVELKEPVYSWQFIEEDGNSALGEQKLPQVDAVIEEVKEGRSIRLIGVGFEGGDTDLTGEHWMALEKAAKLIQKNPENTLVIESYSEGASEAESVELAKARGQNMLAVLIDQFQVNSPKIIVTTHGSSEAPPSYPEYSGGTRRQRVDFVVIERK